MPIVLERLAEAGQRRREDLVPLQFEQIGDAPPAPAVMPGAVHQDEGLARLFGHEQSFAVVGFEQCGSFSAD